MRRCALALALVAAAVVPGAVAWAAFATGVGAGASLATFTVPVPGNLRCTGLLQLATSRLVWDPVAPPAGETVDYVVTLPDGRTATTGAAFHQLPAITLVPGRYAVQARVSSGWRSQPATITVTLGALGLLYLCSTP